MLASELFAKSQSSVCSGIQSCYYCGSCCTEDWLHSEPAPIPFYRSRGPWVARPSEPWMCAGCFLWRRPRVTVPFLLAETDSETAPLKDCQTAIHHSWLVTDDDAKAIVHASHGTLYTRLLTPPRCFFLSLLTDRTLINHIQLCQVNEHAEVRADTPLAFTVDNIAMTYTVYELEEALRGEVTGKEPGVRELIRLLGPHQLPPKPERKKVKGRPEAEPDGKITTRKVS